MVTGVEVLANDGATYITAVGGETSLAFDFLLYKAAYIKIIRTRAGVQTTLVLNTDYTVPPGSLSQELGGTVNLIGTALPAVAADKYALLLNVTAERLTDYNDAGDFFADALNLDLDLGVQRDQQLNRSLAKSVKVSDAEDESTVNLTLPLVAARASRVQAFDANGNLVVSNVTLAQLEGAATAGVNANAFYAAATGGTGDALTATVGLVAYAVGQTFRVVFSASNTLTAPTINFDGKGVKTIKRRTPSGKVALLAANEYYAGFEGLLSYDGTDMILTNPNLLIAGMASINTGADLTGTDSINTYGQVDAYQPNSAMGAVGAITVPGISASTSRGTGVAPSNSVANDLIGGDTMFAYIAGVYQAAAAAVGRVVGAVAGNLGGQWEVWTKKDNGILTQAVVVDQNQNMTVAGTLTATGGINGLTGQNAIVNGDFRIAQRGTSSALATAVAYFLDRWTARSTGTTSATIAQVASGLTGTQYALKIGRNNGISTATVIELIQALESIDCTQYQGKTVTLSFMAKVGANFSAAGGSIGLSLFAGTGTDQSAATIGTWTGVTSPLNTGLVPTAAWQKFTFTAAIPANATQLGVYFNFTPTGTSGADDNLYLTQVKLGTDSTFDPRTTEQELRLCQRWYQQDSFSGLRGGYGTATGAPSAVWGDLKVTMRAAPTFVSVNGVQAAGTQTKGANASSWSQTAGASPSNVAQVTSFTVSAEL